MCNIYSRLVLLVSLSIHFSANAQVPELDWVKTFGDTDLEWILESRLDAQGNIINMGGFYGAVDFNPGPAQYVLQTPAPAAGMFIQKLDANGNFLWAKAITSPDHINGSDLEIGTDDAIYITGTFNYHVIDFDPDSSQTHYVNGSTTSPSMYLLKLDAQGQFKWVNVQSGNITPTFIELDTLGNSYQIGTFDNYIDGDPDPLVTNYVLPQVWGMDDFFIQKLDTTGNQLWFKIVKGAKDIQANALTLNNQQQPVIAGTLRGTVDFDPGTAIYSLSSGDNTGNYSSGFILVLDTGGAFKKAIALQGLGFSEFYNVQIDSDHNFIVAGLYDELADFDPGSGVTNPPSSNSEGYFIEKLDSSGIMQWVHPYQNSIQSFQGRPTIIALSESGSIYVTGYYSIGNMELEPYNINGITLSNSQTRNAYIVEHDSSGTVLWGHGFEGGGRAFNIFRDASGSLYLSGYFMSTTSFDPYNPGNTTTNNGLYDCFLLKFKSCPPLPSEVLADTNTATLVWDNANAYPGNYKLSWYSCDGDSLISGETDTTFSPVRNGSYALIIEKNGCLDTSDCFSIQNVGLNEVNPLTTIQLFPNPTHNLIHISGLHKQIARITVMDVSGRKICELYNQDFIDLENVKPGTYFVLIEMDGFVEVKQVVRKP